MLPVGYMRKRIAKSPADWLEVGTVDDLYSVSGCLSGNFADYIDFWKHNGFWLFDSPRIIDEVSAAHGIDLAGTTLFYYEVHEREYDEEGAQWLPFSPEPSFVTNVQTPVARQLEGFDVVTFSTHSGPECSPLSCCAVARAIPVNEHCLIRSFAEARAAVEGGQFSNSEPGPFRIFAVYSVQEPAEADRHVVGRRHKL